MEKQRLSVLSGNVNICTAIPATLTKLLLPVRNAWLDTAYILFA